MTALTAVVRLYN